MTTTAIELHATALPRLTGADLAGYRLGRPQRAGSLTMVPVFGPAYPGIAPPRSAIKLQRVAGYGSVVLANPPGGTGLGIVPLHIGYVQEGAQNHALCASGFLAPGQERTFADACCVQQSQGGYLSEKDQWFFILPVELRAQALSLRGQQSYSKLWPAITALVGRYGLPARGHLEQILSRKRAVLTQYRSRLELLPGQLGALFFLGPQLVGVEIAPDPRYFAEVWMALVCFAYGIAEWHAPRPAVETGPYPDVTSLPQLRAALAAQRAASDGAVPEWLGEAGWRVEESVEEERYLDLRLSTVQGERFAGQVVRDGERLVYASLFAKEIWLTPEPVPA